MQRQLRESQNAITMMIDDSFASVYSHLHLAIEGTLAPASSKYVPAIRGLLLLWLLGAAVDAINQNSAERSEGGDARRRVWLKRLLEFISRDLSIAQASSVVDLI